MDVRSEARSSGRQPAASGSRVLGGSRRSPHLRRDARRTPRRARCDHGQTEAGVRTERPDSARGRSESSLRARDLQGPRHRRSGRAGVPGARTGRRRVGVRRAHRPPGLGVPHRAARERAGQRHLGRRVVARAHRRQRVVDDGRRRGARPRVPADRLGVGTISTAAIARDRTSTPTASSRSTRRPAAFAGTFKPFTTISGTTTSRRSRCWSRCGMTAGASTPWRRSRRPDSSTCWIARRDGRCFPSRSGRCRRARCRAKRRGRRSPFRRSRRRSRASRR